MVYVMRMEVFFKKKIHINPMDKIKFQTFISSVGFASHFLEIPTVLESVKIKENERKQSGNKMGGDGGADHSVSGNHRKFSSSFTTSATILRSD